MSKLAHSGALRYFLAIRWIFFRSGTYPLTAQTATVHTYETLDDTHKRLPFNCKRMVGRWLFLLISWRGRPKRLLIISNLYFVLPSKKKNIATADRKQSIRFVSRIVGMLTISPSFDIEAIITNSWIVIDNWKWLYSGHSRKCVTHRTSPRSYWMLNVYLLPSSECWQTKRGNRRTQRLCALCHFAIELKNAVPIPDP